MNKEVKKIILGGGCFWCTEAIFKDIEGITKIVPGYAGGMTENPNYEEVCSGDTGHAEVVYIEYDPEKVYFEKILEVFFATHDPTTLNKQGNDVGTQYRSLIMYYDDMQKEVIDLFVENLEEEKVYDNKIVTEILPATQFYEAEEYHHNYFERNPDQAYCQLVIKPKIDKFKEKK